MQKTGPHPRPTELKLAFYQDPQVVLSTFQLRNTVLKQSCLVLGCTLERVGGLPQTLLAVVAAAIKNRHHCRGGGLHRDPAVIIARVWIHCCQVRNTVGVPGPHLPAGEAQCPPEGKDRLCHSEAAVRRAQRRSRAGGLQQPDKERTSGLHIEGCLGQGSRSFLLSLPPPVPPDAIHQGVGLGIRICKSIG